MGQSAGKKGMIRTQIVKPISLGTGTQVYEESVIVPSVAKRLIGAIPIVIVYIPTVGETVTVLYRIDSQDTEPLNIEFASDPIMAPTGWGANDHSIRVFMPQQLHEVSARFFRHQTVLRVQMNCVKANTVAPLAGLQLLYEDSELSTNAGK